MGFIEFEDLVDVKQNPKTENLDQLLCSYQLLQANQNNYSITFEESWAGYCVGFIDIVNSTKITARLTGNKLSIFYGIFLNFMGKAARESGAVVVKNIGDSLLYYYPQTIDAERKDSIIKCLDGNLRITRLHKDINKMLSNEKLPRLDYRISCDYGQVILARAINYPLTDIFGTTVNVCARINRIASPNTFVIGGDLYSIVKDEHKYSFSEVDPFSLGFNFSYPVYSITEGRNKEIER
jgi:class 3 adenylate cyclase